MYIYIYIYIYIYSAFCGVVVLFWPFDLLHGQFGFCGVVDFMETDKDNTVVGGFATLRERLRKVCERFCESNVSETSKNTSSRKVAKGLRKVSLKVGIILTPRHYNFWNGSYIHIYIYIYVYSNNNNKLQNNTKHNNTI